MPRNDPRYVAGDRLEDGAGNVAEVRELPGQNGPYLKALVVSGRRSGDWVWPEKFAKPRVDWDEAGRLEVCGDCERRFRGKVGLMSTVFCVQCERAQAARDSRRAADTSLAEYRWRPKVYASEQARRDADESPF